MVHLEPPRSRAVEKRNRTAKEEARARTALSERRLSTLNDEQREVVTPFVSSVQAYVGYYARLASNTKLPSANAASAAAGTDSAAPPRADDEAARPHRIRPSSANVSLLSWEAPFRNQYTQSQEAAEKAEKARLANLQQQQATPSSPSPITGLSTSFYSQCNEASRSKAAKSASTAPLCPSLSLKPLRQVLASSATSREDANNSMTSASASHAATTVNLMSNNNNGDKTQNCHNHHSSPNRHQNSKFGHDFNPKLSSLTAATAEEQFNGTMLGRIKQQVCAEADETFSHLRNCYEEYHRERLGLPRKSPRPMSTPPQAQAGTRSGQRSPLTSTPLGQSDVPPPSLLPKKNSNDDEDHMLSLLVEAITNESMRSLAEQNKTVLGFDPFKNQCVEFTEFATQNALLEFIGGQSRDVNGVHQHTIASLSEDERHKMEVLSNQVRRGFSHKGISVADELPIAIIFPTYDELAVNSDDGKRPIDHKRLNVHTRCMLVGSLILPDKGGGGGNSSASPTAASTSTLGGSGPTKALGQLSGPHPFRQPSAFNPTLIARPTLTTVTAEHSYKQARRRETRERIRVLQAMERIEAKTNSASTEQQVEAALESRRLVMERSLKPKTDEAILEEVLMMRRGYRVSESVLDAVHERMRHDAQPLRPMREVKRVQIEDFAEYRDCLVRPAYLVTYEVPNNRVDAPTRSTLDPSVLLTTKASLFDDAYPFEKLEYTMRWGLPIGSLTPSTFAQDCWVRKVIRVPTGAGGSSHLGDFTSRSGLSSARGGSAATIATAGSAFNTPIPLGALLQACGRGAVSIDVQGSETTFRHSTNPTVNHEVSIVPPHYRHSFLFAERGVAAILKDRRYGKNSRHLGVRIGILDRSSKSD